MAADRPPQGQYSKLATRYAALTARAKAGDSLVPDTAYADFLKELERQSLPNTVPTSPPSYPPFHRGGGRTGQDGSEDRRGTAGRSLPPRALGAISVRERAQQSLDDTDRHLKAIDDHMQQHRMEERALKRAEMDVMKQRRTLQETMRKLNTELAKRHEEEAEQLSLKEGGLVAYQQKALHERGENMRESTKTAQSGRQRLNEQTKKFMKKEQEMSWRYQNLINVLQMKKDEIDKLSSEFEKSIRAKEEEQHSLKKELATLAISMNMEAQKKRQMLTETGQQTQRATAREIMDNLQQQDKEEAEKGVVVTAGRRYENTKREMEQSATSRKDKLLARQREEGRKLMDVQTKQRMNVEQQRFTSGEAEHIQLDMMGRQIETRIQEVEAKKQARMEAVQKQTSARNRREVEAWSRRMEERENETRRRAHAERLKQLSRVVGQYESQEHSLYHKAREAEGVRRKQVVVVEKLQDDLDHLKQRNAIKLKEAALQAQKAEKEMHQKILRESAELTRAANIHQEATHSLVSHRQRTLEDKRMLTEEKKEHQRRTRIANRTALSQAA